jgi:hypothetical protein
MVQNNLTKKRVAGLSIYLKRAFRYSPQNRDSLEETNPDAFQHLQLNHP